MKILLIDDDVELNKLTSDYLMSKSFAVHQAYSGQEAVDLLPDVEPDVILLDIMMPGMDGYEVLKKIRETLSTPVIMLTARGDDVDKILGLEMGADDYLSKPFNPRELEARIKAILRRIELVAKESESNSEMTFDCFTLNADSYSFYCNDELVDLTNTEFEIMSALLESPSLLIDKGDISMRALGKRLGAYDRSIDMHMSNLRKKLGDAGEQIITVRGKGYRLVPKDAISFDTK